MNMRDFVTCNREAGIIFIGHGGKFLFFRSDRFETCGKLSGAVSRNYFIDRRNEVVQCHFKIIRRVKTKIAFGRVTYSVKTLCHCKAISLFGKRGKIKSFQKSSAFSANPFCRGITGVLFICFNFSTNVIKNTSKKKSPSA